VVNCFNSQIPGGVLAEVLFVVEASPEESRQLFEGDHALQPNFRRLHATGDPLFFNSCSVSTLRLY
jgi:hypothetical protein